MDLSKLPKLSESPPPPAGATQAQVQTQPQPTAGDATPATHTSVSPREQRFEYGLDAFISLIVGGIFLMMGGNYLRHLIAKSSGQQFDTGLKWLEGDKIGQKVEYFDLQGGTAYGERGFFLLGAALILAAAVLLLAIMAPKLRRTLLALAVVLAVGGAVANVFPIVTLLKIGIQPMMSMVAVLVGGILAFFYGRHFMEARV
jgi:hypothetical protein